jgi:hypothetical protein
MPLDTGLGICGYVEKMWVELCSLMGIQSNWNLKVATICSAWLISLLKEFRVQAFWSIFLLF